MRVMLIVSALLIAAASPTMAETRSEDAPADASTPAIDADLFGVLARATERAEAFAEARYAFTAERTVRDKDDEAATFTAEFDPRREEDGYWRLIAPTPEEADKKVRKALKRMNKRDGGDEALVYDGMSDLRGIELVEDGPETAIFASRDLGDDAPEGKLEARLFLDKAGGYISKIEVRTIDSFKPLPIVKIKELLQVQEYAAPVGDGPALLVRSSSRTVGSAAFRSFEMNEETTFTDIRAVDAPPREKDDEDDSEEDDES
ncbi:MAG: hypothetical protein AAFX08_11455 [Pseudomonadota bacterium]